MNCGRKLRVLRRVFERAALRLRINWMTWRLRRRAASALTNVETGEALVATGEKAGDARVIADGKALIAEGWGTLERIGVKP